MGWIVLAIGVIQVLAAFSIWAGGSSAAGSGSSPVASRHRRAALDPRLPAVVRVSS